MFRYRMPFVGGGGVSNPLPRKNSNFDPLPVNKLMHRIPTLPMEKKSWIREAHTIILIFYIEKNPIYLHIRREER